MNQFKLIQSFAKGKATDNAKQSQRNAVIYTRVSTKEQADTNQSLETQKKYCLQYALKQDLNVLGFFGGTYESAKTEERNEFNRMIRFVKNQKEGVSVILVYSLDRFSRTGDNAIFISSEITVPSLSSDIAVSELARLQISNSLTTPRRKVDVPGQRKCPPDPSFPRKPREEGSSLLTFLCGSLGGSAIHF